MVSIAKAGGIAPLVQLLDDGTEQATVFAADALDRLAANDNIDNQTNLSLIHISEPTRPC